ncbi:hypothetical protein [Allocoleopsis sp.]|uniref:hypothetical protein n=1 Tax=Allocoleopsis sp. TaxID=3088169 RepID=UPI002FD5E288
MIKNEENQLEYKRQACPEGFQPKSIQQIREEAEKKVGTTNQEIDGRLCNLRASQELDKQIEQKLAAINIHKL